MESQLKPKVTSRINYERPRPASPFKQPAPSLSPPLARPKAKVNSSATIRTGKPGQVVSSPPSARGSSAPTRAPSPFKPPQSRTTTSSPAAGSAVRARLTARTNGNNSTSPLPESRQRALTAGTPSQTASFVRQRRGSVSSNLLVSPTHTEISVGSSPGRSPLSLHPDENIPSSPVSPNVSVRVKAKVSRVAEAGVHSPPTLPPSPRLANRPARVPSISNLSLSPPLMPSNSSLSPSSASSPSASQLRFGSTRETKHQSFQALPKAFQSFTPNDDTAIDYGGSARGPGPKVDPTAIPLPPQSPPTSTVSFSSHSSASRSSVSYETQDSGFSRSTAPTLHSTLNGNGHIRQGSHSSQARASIDGLGFQSAPVTRETSSGSDPDLSDDYDGDAHHADGRDDAERKMKAEAKSNRKIADLEITNRSLLAINSSLEATKHKQAKEIRELRRKLRESRLILPPPAYRAVKSSLTYDDTAEEDDDDEEDEDDEEDDKELLEGKADKAYQRVRVMIEGLLESGRRALESKPEDFVNSSKGGAKVLTAEEVRNWRGDDNDTETRSMLDADASPSSSRPLTPSRVAVPDSDDGLGSEDEVEATLDEPDARPLAPLPPITITPSASP
ncbi:hypothetical protein L227DRAFT_507263 [Lentinus tigrinus ALCF2SS1-6]|uniref:Uncharacterized protein n=1 Tax=Lentinus tigrinus ALCF2SS1-6 TaxID=1328759 RepID=A0A5C2S0X9_9APHY|nr:hypothetical protein L227DRAFT_507263 [Lentinus tigrinus ALCF2SS1-6]